MKMATPSSVADMPEVDDDSSWILELEAAVAQSCDFATVHRITKGRPVPNVLRPKIWQLALGVHGKSDGMSNWDQLYDMEEQNELRADCNKFVDKLGNEEEDKVAIVSDLESVVTCYCKTRNAKYHTDNGWLDVLQPFVALKLPRSHFYNCFHAIANMFIPRECVKNGRPFHLFRLLLLYHEPELCSFLDTKRITPDTYSLSWICSLFAADCDLPAVLAIWDMYFQQGDPFLVFFLALVILVNAKDTLFSLDDTSKDSVIKALKQVPCQLEADDVQDFCSLAQYYASKTPQSFRTDYQGPLFGVSAMGVHAEDIPVSQALCLPVSVDELLQANQLPEESVHYFVVDCRPADQYNHGHLPTAFHLDANLMLHAPSEFAVAVQALFTAQKQALAVGSHAGGEHLCLMGSGREEEDQYVHMVVANMLQRKTQYVSLALGGYTALHTLLRANLDDGLTDHDSRACLICNPDTNGGGGVGSGSDVGDFNWASEDFTFAKQKELLRNKFVNLTNVVKTKSVEMRDQLTNYIVNPVITNDQLHRHVSSSDKVGKRYRNLPPVFSIGDEPEDEFGSDADEQQHRERVNIDTWLNKADVIAHFKCQEVKDGTFIAHPSYLLLTHAHLFILREIANQADMAYIVGRRPLVTILKITSKRRSPELITFKYGAPETATAVPAGGQADDDGDKNGAGEVRLVERFYIPKAGEATKAIKQQIYRIAEQL